MGLHGVGRLCANEISPRNLGVAMPAPLDTSLAITEIPFEIGNS